MKYTKHSHSICTAEPSVLIGFITDILACSIITTSNTMHGERNYSKINL